MANKFRDKTMRKEYDAAVNAYTIKHRDLFYPDGSRCTGSSFAEMFWKGFEGVWADCGGKPNGYWNATSKKMLAYAYWRAGQDMRKKEA